MMPKAYWHKKWVENLEKVLWFASKYWIKTITAWALSTENMKRSEEELSDLYAILEKFCNKKDLFEKNWIKFTYIWDISTFPKSTIKSIEDLMLYSKDFNKFNLQIALNYWWKSEILRTINKIIAKWETVCEQTIANNLDTALLWDPELIVRTWWHKRLSWFLMWQSAYSELYFTDKLWPDFNEKELKKAIEFFESSQRNFGK